MSGGLAGVSVEQLKQRRRNRLWKVQNLWLQLTKSTPALCIKAPDAYLI
jgi:hypothetical protein